MGLSFHYRGRLKSADLLPALVDEVADVCDILKWPFDIFETQYPEHEFAFPPNDQSYGISFTPEDSEPVLLIFDSEGRLFNPSLHELIKSHREGQVKIITIKLDLSDKNPQPEISDSHEEMDMKNMVFTLSVKTFFKNPERSARLLEFLRYISKRYLIEFTLEDESQYWNSQNTDIWHSQWENIHEFINQFNEMIKDEPIESTEDFISFVRKMANMMKKYPDKSDEDIDSPEGIQ